MQLPEKPNFLIVGAPKCGTTSLASILDQHPDCCMSRPKEVSFFQDKLGNRPNPNYEKGWEWYAKAFAHYDGEKAIGEATPSYSNRGQSPNTAQRIYQFNPDMKIIYMVRNPLERQISAWKMQYYWSVKKLYPNMEDCKWARKGFSYWMERQKAAGTWSISQYAFQLDAYKKYFTNILVSFLEDWENGQSQELDRIFNFLELDHKRFDEHKLKKENVSEQRKVESGLQQKLKELPFLGSVINVIPIRIKKRLKDYFGIGKVKYPAINTSEKVIEEFILYIKEDSDDLLREYNKSMHFWSYDNLLK